MLNEVLKIVNLKINTLISLIFVHFDARKLMGARNSEVSFMSSKIFFKGSDFILTMSKGSFLIREAHQAEHKERLRSRKQYL